MNTPVKRKEDVVRQWIVIDGSTAPLGRVAAAAAGRLIGKYQPDYTPHVDSGDYVVIINADKLVVTGRKSEEKTYYRHSGYPGSLKERTLRMQQERDSREVFVKAVKGMLPKNKLASDRLARLRVFPGAEHDHAAQSPKEFKV